MSGLDDVIMWVRNADDFDMQEDCSCIGGVCAASLPEGRWSVLSAFQAVSGIADMATSMRVVFPGWPGRLRDLKTINKPAALRMLEILRDEEIVDWDRASVESGDNEHAKTDAMHVMHSCAGRTFGGAELVQPLRTGRRAGARPERNKNDSSVNRC